MTEKCTIIHTYSRREAIADGVLIDVTKAAKEAGFCVPVAVTASVWAECVAVPTGVECQDKSGRLWDVLYMLFTAIRATRVCGAEIRYRLHVRNDNRRGEPPLVELKAIFGPNDDGTPCVTVMLPEED